MHIPYSAKDYLRDENREVNHHGSVRTLEADGNDVEENKEKVVDLQTGDNLESRKNTWVGDEPLHLALISRKENVQVAFVPF